mmetsp:Transcript_126980/g.219790  ORF Transcript_126980/g.219790 Transcript_126980/m.219790 type:complete len:227 (+) Transcript_126980:1100-1780(+)
MRSRLLGVQADFKAGLGVLEVFVVPLHEAHEIPTVPQCKLHCPIGIPFLVFWQGLICLHEVIHFAAIPLTGVKEVCESRQEVGILGFPLSLFFLISPLVICIGHKPHPPFSIFDGEQVKDVLPLVHKKIPGPVLIAHNLVVQFSMVGSEDVLYLLHWNTSSEGIDSRVGQIVDCAIAQFLFSIVHEHTPLWILHIINRRGVCKSRDLACNKVLRLPPDHIGRYILV